MIDPASPTTWSTLTRWMPTPADRARLGRTEPWLRVIGLLIWAFIGLTRLEPKPWVIPWLIYAAAFLALGLHSRFPQWLKVALLATQSAAVLALPRFGLSGFEGLLLSIVVTQVPIVLSLRHAISWAVGQVPPMMIAVYPYNNFRQLMEILGAYSAFTLFALLVYRLHLQELRARTELASTNAALLSTRAMLVEASRQTERLRISRELHDSLGHHLTALSLQLELAQRIGAGPAVEPVNRAREISRASLAEVRKVVGEMQSPQSLDLVAALKALAGGIPEPKISIQAPERLAIDDAEAGHVLFRCIQEAITNSVKHASAQQIWVEIHQTPSLVEVTIRADGQGIGQLKRGNGLEGMQARVAQVKGKVAFDSAPGRGFTVRLEVPTGGAR